MVISFTGVVTSLCVGLPPAMWVPLWAGRPHANLPPGGMEGVNVPWMKDSLFCCCAVVSLSLQSRALIISSRVTWLKIPLICFREGSSGSLLTSHLSHLCAWYPDGGGSKNSVPWRE